MSAKLLAVDLASSDYVEGAIGQSVGMMGGGYVWHGWSLRDAFVAGARWHADQVDNVLDEAYPYEPGSMFRAIAQIGEILSSIG